LTTTALDDTIKQVEILADKRPSLAIVDKGHRSVQVRDANFALRPARHPNLEVDDQTAKRIEPTIGHMKTKGRPTRDSLKGALGDALHDVLCVPQPPADIEKAVCFSCRATKMN